MAQQTVIPSIVGAITETIVHFRLFVSLCIVNSVVEQGQCSSEKTITFVAVRTVQPLSDSILNMEVVSKLSLMAVLPRYNISMRGRTISFAGNEKMKAVIITPSIPRNLPKGSKKLHIYVIAELLSM